MNYFLERGGIGDMLMRLPYYSQLITAGVDLRIILPEERVGLFAIFLPERHLIQAKQLLLAKSSIYAAYFRHVNGIDAKNDRLYIPLPYHHTKLFQAARRLELSTTVYAGSMLPGTGLDLSGFNVIDNPYPVNEYGYGAHISRHSDVFFRSLFPQLGSYESIYRNYPRMKQNNGHGAQYDLVIMTDAGVAWKRYPQTAWQRFLDMLPRKLKILQTGTDMMQLKHPGLTDSGRLPLAESFGLVSGAGMMIGNDTGLTHWSYLCGNKTICLLGSGDLYNFLPWDCGLFKLKCIFDHNCICCDWNCRRADLKHGTAPCIAQIKPEEIMETYLSMM